MNALGRDQEGPMTTDKQAVLELRRGLVTGAARELGVSYGTARNWCGELGIDMVELGIDMEAYRISRPRGWLAQLVGRLRGAH